jgi:hypothetical protein
LSNLAIGREDELNELFKNLLDKYIRFCICIKYLGKNILIFEMQTTHVVEVKSEVVRTTSPTTDNSNIIILNINIIKNYNYNNNYI